MKKKSLKKLLVGFALLGMTLTGCNNSDSNGGTKKVDQKYEIYQLAVESGYTGTYEEWLASIRGADGTSILVGETAPSDEQGNNGDTYINYSTWDIYVKIGGSWNKVGNIMGKDGKDGKDGDTPYIGENGNWWIGEIDTGVKAQGNPGENGQTPYIGENGNWWIGSQDTGVKAAGENGQNGQTPRIGENGNWWIGDQDTGVKAEGKDGENGLTPYIGENGNWWIGDQDTEIKAVGKDGENGENGNSVLTGAGAPSNELGKVGDSYIDTLTWDYYIKESSGWVLKGNIRGEDGLSATDYLGQGLDFYLKDDGTYAVRAGHAALLSSVVIPDTFNGRQVTEIMEYGFSTANTNVQSRIQNILIPTTVTKIGDHAFCDSPIKKIVYPGPIENFDSKVEFGEDWLISRDTTDFDIEFNFSNGTYHLDSLLTFDFSLSTDILYMAKKTYELRNLVDYIRIYTEHFGGMSKSIRLSDCTYYSDNESIFDITEYDLITCKKGGTAYLFMEYQGMRAYHKVIVIGNVKVTFDQAYAIASSYTPNMDDVWGWRSYVSEEYYEVSGYLVSLPYDYEDANHPKGETIGFYMAATDDYWAEKAFDVVGAYSSIFGLQMGDYVTVVGHLRKTVYDGGVDLGFDVGCYVSREPQHATMTFAEYNESLKNTKANHLYIHYYNADQMVYPQYDIWAWQYAPKDGAGMRFDWVAYGDYGGAYVDIDLTQTYDGGWNSEKNNTGGTTVSYSGATKIGFLVVDKSSRRSGGNWISDGGRETYITLADYKVAVNGGGYAYHVFVMSGSVTSPSKSTTESTRL